MNGILLSNGVVMPKMVLSTFGMQYDQMKRIVRSGLDSGFRAFDTANKYGNEHVVGRVLSDCLRETGMSRNDIFITTKISPDQQREGNVLRQAEVSLENLRTDYIDLWLIHWPCPDYYIETLKKMVLVQQKGLVRALGLANPQLRHLELLKKTFPVMPIQCIQLELHPFRTCKKIVEWCRTNNISIESYSPLCKMIPMVSDNPLLNELARKYEKTIGQVVLRWHLQRNYIPVFMTKKPDRVYENWGAFDFSLSECDMGLIDGLNCNYKLLIESILCPGY